MGESNLQTSPDLVTSQANPDLGAVASQSQPVDSKGGNKKLLYGILVVGFFVCLGFAFVVIFSRNQACRCGKGTKTINSTDEVINLVRQCFPELKDIPIRSATPNKSSGVLIEEDEDGFRAYFYEGKGDCPSGCIEDKEYYFWVSRKGCVEKLGEYKDTDRDRLTSFITRLEPVCEDYYGKGTICRCGNSKATGEYMLLIKKQGDVSKCADKAGKVEKGTCVSNELQSVAEKDQKEIINHLEQNGFMHRDFWITNQILVSNITEEEIDIIYHLFADKINRIDETCPDNILYKR